jgi:hypothetical protein
LSTFKPEDRKKSYSSVPITANQSSSSYLMTTISEFLSQNSVEIKNEWRNSGREDSFRYRWVATYATGSKRLLNTNRCVMLSNHVTVPEVLCCEFPVIFAKNLMF